VRTELMTVERVSCGAVILLRCARAVLSLVVLFALSCSHADELAQLERDRRPRLPVLPAGDGGDLPIVPPAVPEPCISLLGATEGLRVGPSADVSPASPTVDVAIALRVAPSCQVTTLQLGLCQRDSSGLVIAPASWQSTMSIEPGREYGPVISMPDVVGPYLPCVLVDQIYNVSAERICEGTEIMCAADRTCYADTQKNALHCGPGCDVCKPGPQGTPFCNEGKCELKCNEGYRYDAGQCRFRPGCKGLETACGGKDCCAIDEINAGAGQQLRVKRGWDASNSAAEIPEFQPSTTPEVTIDPFWMDRYEVTVGRFRRFVDAFDAWVLAANPKVGAGAHPKLPGSGWNQAWTDLGFIRGSEPIYVLPPSREELIKMVTHSGCGAAKAWTDQPGANESLAMNCVDFFSAFLYCIWDGDGRLPTEAEWNAAAAGGDQQRAYPWSDPDHASLDLTDRVGPSGGDMLPFAVGLYPKGAGRWKTLDLAGNVFEWVRDTANYPGGKVSYINQPNNPLNLSGDANPQQAHALRSGSFKKFCLDCQTAARLRTSAREVLVPWNSFNDTGVRCVRSF